MSCFDLIIVGGRSAAKYEALGKIAPTLDFSVRGDHLLQDMARNITQLAQLSGQPAQGQALLARLEREVGVVRHLAAQAEPGLLLMGGGDRNFEAMRWFMKKAGNGHIVVLRASQGGEIGEEFFNEVGGIQSVETFVFSEREQSNDRSRSYPHRAGQSTT